MIGATSTKSRSIPLGLTEPSLSAAVCGYVAIAVFNVDGHYYAIEDLCSHESSTLANGTLSGLEIICPRHEARFSLVTGEALSPPAYEPVPVFPVRVEAGRVQVRDPRFD